MPAYAESKWPLLETQARSSNPGRQRFSHPEAKSQDLPTITQVALDELQARVAKGFGHDLPSPFYRMLHRKFVRAEL